MDEFKELIEEAERRKKQLTSRELEELLRDQQHLTDRMLFEQVGYLDGQDKPNGLINNENQ